MTEEITVSKEEYDDFWMIKKTETGKYATVYGESFKKDPDPDVEGLESKYIFETFPDALFYASKNYVTLGVILHSNITVV